MLKKYCARNDVASVATITTIHKNEDVEENEDMSDNSIIVGDVTIDGSYKLHNFWYPYQFGPKATASFQISAAASNILNTRFCEFVSRCTRSDLLCVQ